jgi:organic radical activating enzyme
MSDSRPTFRRVAVIVTQHCNLRCKLCAIAAPYYKEKYHPALDYLYTEIDRLFEIAKWRLIEFSGGEPLLRSDLPQVVSHMRDYLSDVEEVRIVTNGTMTPDDALVAALSSLNGKAYVIVDDYGEGLSPNAETAYEKLTANGIQAELRNYTADNPHCGGWVDFGIVEQNRNKVEQSRAEQSRAEQSRAEQSLCIRRRKENQMYVNTVIDGVLTVCGHFHTIRDFRSYDLPLSHYVDIFDNGVSIGEIRARIADGYTADWFDACKYCNGLTENSKRYIPAEQF